MATQVINGDLSIDEGALPFIQTEENERLEKAKLLEIQLSKLNILNSWALPLAYDEGLYYTLAVPVYQQPNDYTCGPATVKQVAQFLKGSSLPIRDTDGNSSNDYASILGTTSGGTNMIRIHEYVKASLYSGYTYSSIGTFGDWMGKVQWGCANRKPSIIDINTINLTGWPYETDGHFVNTSGFDTKYGSRVRITDPYGPGLGNHWYTSSLVYNANNKHWRKAIVW